MSCSSCGSSSGCSCLTTLSGIGSGCNNCGTAQGSRAPFFMQGDNVLENHCQQIICERFSPVFCTNSSWNVPNCDGTATFVVGDATYIPVGAYAWFPGYGYFLITAFDSVTGEVTIQNTCITENAAPGTQIAQCSCFLVSPPPCDDLTPITPYVAEDFVAPAVASCVVITVTTTEGIVAGQMVSISTGSYGVDAVLTDTTMRICNDGNGIAAGTTVVALDSNGNYQYPITVLAGSQSDSDDVNSTGDVDSGSTTLVATGNAVSITNPSTTKDMNVLYTVGVVANGNVETGSAAGLDVSLGTTLDINGGGAASIGTVSNSVFPGTDDPYGHSLGFNYVGVATLAPLATYTVQAESTVTWISGGSSEYNDINLDLNVTMIGVL